MKKTIIAVLFSYTFLLLIVAEPVWASLEPIVQEIGKISISVDGEGNNSTAGGTIRVDKPAGATVRKAFFMANSHGVFGDRVISDGDVTLNGTPVKWNRSVFNGVPRRPKFFHNVFADVTSLIKPFIDQVQSGITELQVTETGTTQINGTILVVVFDDPNQSTENSVILLFGDQATSGDTFKVRLSKPIDLSAGKADMGLGIGHSFQGLSGTPMGNLIDVNGTRLTSSAGGEDDGNAGIGGDGTLITVGGIGDSNNNPDTSVPSTGFDTDDELYNLLPFIRLGDTEINVSSFNPTDDDNIFFAYFVTSVPSVIFPPAVVEAPQQPFIQDISPETPDPQVIEKNLVLVAHGWNSNAFSGGWVTTMTDNIKGEIDKAKQEGRIDPNTRWTVIPYDWSQEACFSNILNAPKCFPRTAYTNARLVGNRLGQQLENVGYDHIHFIAHSAGSNVIQAAINRLKAIESQNKPIIHATFLDAYDVHRGESMYGMNANWAEQYVDKRPVLTKLVDDTDLQLPSSFNFDVTHLDPDQDNSLFENDSVRVHAWPYEWYNLTITDPSTSPYGFKLSFESGRDQLESHNNRFFVRGEECTLFGVLDLCTFTFPVAKPVLNINLNPNSPFEIWSTANSTPAFKSDTGTVDLSVLDVIGLTTQSPVWISVPFQVTEPINLLQFDYDFTSLVEGLLSVFLDDQVVFKADERFTPSGVNPSEPIPLGEVKSGTHLLSFRLDRFSNIQSSVKVSNIRTGFMNVQNVADTECLFNWAERNYPALFAPSGSPTAIWDVYTYRYYSATSAYVGVSSADKHVYYMGADGKLLDEGPLADWLPKSGCQPPPPVDCLLNWAENNYPALFSPPGGPTASWDVYTYRHYSATNAYVGVSSADNHVYYMGADGRLLDEGALSDWLPRAGCQ